MKALTDKDILLCLKGVTKLIQSNHAVPSCFMFFQKYTFEKQLISYDAKKDSGFVKRVLEDALFFNPIYSINLTEGSKAICCTNNVRKTENQNKETFFKVNEDCKKHLHSLDINEIPKELCNIYFAIIYIVFIDIIKAGSARKALTDNSIKIEMYSKGFSFNSLKQPLSKPWTKEAEIVVPCSNVGTVDNLTENENVNTKCFYNLGYLDIYKILTTKMLDS